jgi:hypothetical protein
LCTTFQETFLIAVLLVPLEVCIALGMASGQSCMIDHLLIICEAQRTSLGNMERATAPATGVRHYNVQQLHHAVTVSPALHAPFQPIILRTTGMHDTTSLDTAH